MSGPPTTTSASRPSRATAWRTSASWSRPTSGPMVVASSRGSPTRTSASWAASASTTAPTCALGTSERRMAVHFCPVFSVSSRTTSRTNRSNSSLPGVASGPRIEQFSESASALNRTASRTTAGWLRSRLAVAAEPVKPMLSCPVRWSNRSPTPPQSSCTDPGGSSARLDHVPEGQLGHVGGLAGRLDDRRDAGEHGRGQLLQHPPDREVEGVDEHRHPGPGAVDGLADEGPAPAERLRRPVDVEDVVGQLAPALARVHEQGADAPVDVDPGVGQGGPGPRRLLVQAVAVLAQVDGEPLQGGRPLVEGQLAQPRPADRAGVLDHAGQVHPGARHPRHRLPGGRVPQGDALVGRGVPAVADIGADHRGHVGPPLVVEGPAVVKDARSGRPEA